jgi:hypothetical protein
MKKLVFLIALLIPLTISAQHWAVDIHTEGPSYVLGLNDRWVEASADTGLFKPLPNSPSTLDGGFFNKMVAITVVIDSCSALTGTLKIGGINNSLINLLKSSSYAEGTTTYQHFAYFADNFPATMDTTGTTFLDPNYTGKFTHTWYIKEFPYGSPAVYYDANTETTADILIYFQAD